MKKLVKITIFYLTLLGAVLSTPQLHVASDGGNYIIETDLKYNWYQAAHECARRNGHLVTIDSAGKNEAIINMLKAVVGKSHNLWLGGNDEYNTKKDYYRPFFWKATGERFNFTYWSGNSPDNYATKEHCVHIWDGKPLYQWNDIRCTKQMGYLCEVNHYVQDYEKDLKIICDVVENLSSSISSEFNKAKQQQLSEINSRTTLINTLNEKFEADLHLLQSTTQIAIQALLTEQENKMNKLLEKVYNDVTNVYTELQKSTENINIEFSEQLNARQNEITQVC